MIDKLGKCPNCGTDWNGGDVLENLNKIEAFMHKNPEDMAQLGKSLGYSAINKNRFSKTISHEINEVNLIECPNITCGYIFDIITGKGYKSLYDYTLGKVDSEVDSKINKELSPIQEYINADPKNIEKISDEELLKEIKEYATKKQEDNREDDGAKPIITKTGGEIKGRSDIFYKPTGGRWGR